MSSMAALVLLAAAASQAPPAASATPGITAEQAMAQYRAMTSGVMSGKPDETCPEGVADQIVVCARRHLAQPRLPLPEARAEPGEVVRHPGEPPKGDPGRPTGPPPKQMQTLGKLFGLLREAVTGADPDQP
jgi:hypothetical protein